MWVILAGGEGGIRTLDTVAGILHFECSALDQLCDLSVLLVSEFLPEHATIVTDGLQGLQAIGAPKPDVYRRFEEIYGNLANIVLE